MSHPDPLDDLTPAVIAFADKVFDAFDVGEVVTYAAAATAGEIAETTAKQYINLLKPARLWPYRGAWWRSRRDAAGPFADLIHGRAS